MANVKKRGNTYSIRVSCGFDGTGKRDVKCMTWKPPQGMTEKQADKEAERQAVLFEEKCKTGQVLDNNTRLSAFVEIWLKDYAEKQLRPTTLSGYKDMLRRVLAALGNKKINEIQPHHLHAFYDNLAEAGVRADIKYTPTADIKAIMKEKKLTQEALAKSAGVAISVIKSCADGRNVTEKSAEKVSKALNKEVGELFEAQEDDGLSNKTILHHHRLISIILQTAVQWQVIFSNPCSRANPPKVEKTEARYLDEVQTRELLDALDGEPYQYQVVVKLLIHTGMRRGELCGLEWQDIDSDTDCIHIVRSSLYVPDKGVFEDATKNESSQRVLKVSDDVISLLQEYKDWQDERRQEAGSKWECEQNQRLFTTAFGKPIHPDTITGWFHDFIQRKGLPSVSIHSLRHTNATLMIASGVPITSVSRRLGHANPTVTNSIYIHPIKSADEAAAETLKNILTPTENNKKKNKKQEQTGS